MGQMKQFAMQVSEEMGHGGDITLEVLIEAQRRINNYEAPQSCTARKCGTCQVLNTKGLENVQLEIDQGSPLERANRAAAQTALAVQNACNPIAVLAEWHKQMMAIQHAGAEGNQWPNSHAAMMVFLDKMNDLCSRPNGSAMGKVFEACETLALPHEK